MLAALMVFLPPRLPADTGYYAVTQLAISNAVHPSIDNHGEIVWAGQNGGGIYSSVRGQLSATGQSPHITNSGEVVYADSFGGSGLDLVSSTRGRLTTGGVIDLGFSDFGINTNGEVVYVALDSNSLHQVYSTIRGQITFDPVDHYNPCINDHGEILYNRYGEGPGLVSTTRGPLPGLDPTIYSVNNFDEFCYVGNLMSGPLSTSPHLFSSVHGVVVNDAYQYQFGGGINDAGTLVWWAQGNVGVTTYIFEAVWAASPSVTLVSRNPGLALQWPTNAGAFQPQYSTNLASTNWLPLGGGRVTNAGYILQTIATNLGNRAFFKLSMGPP